jgi:hypothetical protein
MCYQALPLEELGELFRLLIFEFPDLLTKKGASGDTDTPFHKTVTTELHLR